MNPVLWRTIHVHNQIFFTKLVAGLLTSPDKSLGQHVRFVDIDVTMTDSHLLLFTKHLPLLKKLKLFDASGITDTGIDYLAQYCPHLKSLYITNGSPEITAHAVRTIGQRFTELCSIYLCRCRGISPSGGTFSALKACPLRKLYLDVGNLVSIENVGIAAELVLDLLRLRRLTNVLLIFCPHYFSQLFYTIKASNERAALATNACYWPNLTDFLMNGCHGVDDSAMVTFIKTQPRLVRFTISGSRFTDTVLEAISTFLPWLVVLNISDDRRIRRVVSVA